MPTVCVDTNLWFYALARPAANEDTKHLAARRLIDGFVQPVVTPQILNELGANLLRKRAWSESDLRALLADLTAWNGQRNAPAFRQLVAAVRKRFDAVQTTERTTAAMHNLGHSFDGANISAISEAAQRGDAKAQGLLGYAYWLGQGGLPKNEGEAIRWFTLASQRGSADAMAQLGNIYSDQDPPRWPQALEWFERAARAGDAYSAYQAYLMHTGGFDGVAKNLILARQYLALAARAGHEEAQKQLASGG